MVSASAASGDSQAAGSEAQARGSSWIMAPPSFHPPAQHVGRDLGPRHRRRQPPPAITASRSHRPSSSSRSSDTITAAPPAARRSISAWWMRAAAPMSTPQVGWAANSTRGAPSSSRPTMNFCRLPPDRLRAGARGDTARTPWRAITRAAASASPRRRIQPRMPPARAPWSAACSRPAPFRARIPVPGVPRESRAAPVRAARPAEAGR